jgi:hypothetical protein
MAVLNAVAANSLTLPHAIANAANLSLSNRE